MLSDVDLFLEGLQLVLSNCLCEGLSWLGKVPARQIKERHKKKSFQSGCASTALKAQSEVILVWLQEYLCAPMDTGE